MLSPSKARVLNARIRFEFDPNYASLCLQYCGSVSSGQFSDVGHADLYPAAGHDSLASCHMELQWQFPKTKLHLLRLKPCSSLAASLCCSSGWSVDCCFSKQELGLRLEMPCAIFGGGESRMHRHERCCLVSDHSSDRAQWQVCAARSR